MLSFLEMTETLFLAIPQAAYAGIFQAPVAQETVKMLGVKLLIFDPVKEEVVLWLR